MSKIGRNESCPCGSGKKYKHCCLEKESRPRAGLTLLDDLLADVSNLASPTPLAFDPPDTPAGRAARILLETWSLPAPLRIGPAKQALAEDPDSIDAYALLGSAATDAEEAIGYYQQALEAAGRVFGPGWQETALPNSALDADFESYLLARNELALALNQVGRTDEAVEHLRQILKLDPDDLNSVRYDLLDLLLHAQRDADALALIDSYVDGLSSRWEYARALLKFRLEGETIWSRLAMVNAFSANDLVPPLLLGLAPIPAEDPDADPFSQESDALDTARSLLDAWQEPPGARDWMRRVFADGPRTTILPKGDGPILCQTPTDVIAYLTCPRCEGKTTPRKHDVVYMIEPDDLIVERLSGRYCQQCGVFSLLSRDVERRLRAGARRHNLDLTGRESMIAGVIDPQAPRRPQTAGERTWAQDHLKGWSDIILPKSTIDESHVDDDEDDLDEDGFEGINDFDDSEIVDVPFTTRPR